MKRMEFRSSEAPMDWEREQDRNAPSIFDAPKESNPPHAAPTRSFSSFAASTPGDVHREFSFSSVQAGNNSGVAWAGLVNTKAVSPGLATVGRSAVLTPDYASAPRILSSDRGFAMPTLLSDFLPFARIRL
ncbi:hypothetical protein BGZ81_002024 [Podila clonocystis]|nr:hypothetical protein BGZ81_002024 [Podila clonocystis]